MLQRKLEELAWSSGRQLLQKKPTVFSFVTPGNVYPAVESPLKQESLKGTSCKNGYQSHYALGSSLAMHLLHFFRLYLILLMITVDATSGLPIRTGEDGTPVDELVVFQENQTLAKYVMLFRK